MTGGCTGLTYNMMAEWPLEVMNAMYDTMSKLDQVHHTPDFWRKKWLVPMPKNSDPTLAELRPLMLIEVSRKLWCSFGINSIWKILERYHVLEDIQFAYRKKREAGIPQLLMRNSIEEAQECESSVAYGSYDLRHAFDSVTHSASKLSLAVVGLEPLDAHWMVERENGCKVTVRTPSAHQYWATAHSWRLGTQPTAGPDEPAFLIPLCGTPQGDTASCLNWTVFENICLAALRLDTRRVRMYIRGPNGELHEAIDLCYAHDLITIAPTVEGLQRNADIVGDIAQALHLQISIAKLRQLAVNYGHELLLPPDPTIRMNDGLGRSAEVPLPSKGPFKQLGYTFTIGKRLPTENLDQEQFTSVKTHLTMVCNNMIRKHADPLSKLVALQTSVINSCLWKAQCAPWSLHMCRELDVPINRLLRHITKNLPGFPTKLLYGAPQDSTSTASPTLYKQESWPLPNGG